MLNKNNQQSNRPEVTKQRMIDSHGHHRAELNLMLSDSSEQVQEKAYFVLAQLAKIVFVFVIIGGLMFLGTRWYHWQAVGEQVNVSNKLNLLNKEIMQYESEQSDLVKIRKRFYATQDLLDHHIYWEKFFNHLEKYTLPGVTYSSLIAEESGQITLAARAEGFQILARQLKVLQAVPAFVSQVDINAGTSSDEENGVVFSINLQLSEDFLLDIPVEEVEKTEQ